MQAEGGRGGLLSGGLMSVPQTRRSWRGLGSLPMKICRNGQYMFDPLNVTFFHSKLLLHNSAMKDERLVSKMEVKSNFSRRLKQFGGLTLLIPTSLFYDSDYGRRRR